jgi:ATP-binding cassette subfamily C (CFTR/MRP) protein 1
MFNSILKSKMRFFESTPVGRIINRFSKDIEAIESMIPSAYNLFMRNLFFLLTTILTISISTPLFLIPFGPILILYLICQRYYLGAMRQIRRLNSINKSPIFSHFGETINGLSTIRCFKKQNEFIKKMENTIDESSLYYYPDSISARWLGTRLEFIGFYIFMMIFFLNEI